MFDSQLFLELANNLFKDRSFQEEARFRTSISRAYYAVFLKVREAISKKKRPPRKGVHQWLIKELKKSQVDDNRQFGIYLESLRHGRNDADYELRLFCDSNKTVLMLHRAKKLWNNCQNLRF